MNIGQILETHLGLVSHYLGGTFVNPIFEARREEDIMQELERLADHLRGASSTSYVAQGAETGLARPTEEMPAQPYRTAAPCRTWKRWQLRRSRSVRRS